MGQNDQENKNSSNSRRRRRRRRRNSRKGSNRQNSGGRKNSSNNSGRGSSRSKRRRNSRRKNSRRGNSRNNNGGGRYKHKTPDEKFGGREPREVGVDEGVDWRLEPFDLFCAYHLGITPDNRYKKQLSKREVTQIFSCSADDLHDALRRFSMDNNSVRSSGFDLQVARLDMQVAPEGLDKRELARVLFDEFLDYNPEVRPFVEEEGGEDQGDTGPPFDEGSDDDRDHRASTG